LQSGDTVTIFGQEFQFVQTKSEIINHKSAIVIGGQPEFYERRVRDKIKEMFLTNVKKIIAEVPRELRPTKICVRDTTSRWGSCSSTGTISLSYRLAFAPPTVMRYVIMHEIAHRKYMDHSPKFWHLTRELYGPGMERIKDWLTKHGSELHRYF
jgi:predicted metal-dependent hydrolase